MFLNKIRDYINSLDMYSLGLDKLLVRPHDSSTFMSTFKIQGNLLQIVNRKLVYAQLYFVDNDFYEDILLDM